MVSYGMPLFLKFLAINDFCSVLACSMAYSHWFILSRSEFIFLMYITSSLLANLRNSTNINVYFQSAVLSIVILWFICGKVCLKKKIFGGVRWIFLFS